MPKALVHFCWFTGVIQDVCRMMNDGRILHYIDFIYDILISEERRPQWMCHSTLLLGTILCRGTYTHSPADRIISGRAADHPEILAAHRHW
ncbi:MAG: hypothetical protein K4571_00040 [Deltaproteobacteria bacterium]